MLRRSFFRSSRAAMAAPRAMRPRYAGRKNTRLRSLFQNRLRNAPVARGIVGRPSKSIIFAKKNKGTTITQREYIGLIQRPANGTGLSNEFGVNKVIGTPGTLKLSPLNKNMFSWLSEMGKLFELYKFHNVALVYEPVCNTNYTGSIALAFDSDPTDPDPKDWKEISNWKGTVHGAPWTAHRLDIPFRDLHRRKNYYCSAANTDLRETITANCFVAIDSISSPLGGTVVQPLGKLYVEYTCTLWNPEAPQTDTIESVPPPNENGLSGQIVTITGTTAGSNVFTATVTDSGPGFGLVDTTNKYYRFEQDAQCLVSILTDGTSLGAETLTFTGTGTATLIRSTVGASGTSAQSVYRLEANSGDYFTYTRAGTTLTACTIRFAGYSYDLA